ncbi:hypothetical protein EDF46_0952 [Frondihabitans sp. PhB188]|uniref:hypothetical protein n=1 Tax=Frondihabitans sp. PhB188 TaxID=2485200 RepID=UPI000F47E211|nr:hypothetical protein [Frondihabitans sp. PhB188]ROQ41571.1 hypothetical protein EDF46_0952 [Frondihabitans sp. PhB188]
MSDDDEMTFTASGMSEGVELGGLQDPTRVSVHLTGFTYGAEKGWEWFEAATERHVAVVRAYARILREAGGDVTQKRVQLAANALHQSIGALPIGHTAYAGVGFPSASNDEVDDVDIADIEAMPAPPVTEVRAPHPYLATAVSGTRMQRLELAGADDLPLEVELVLAKDPDESVRDSFLGRTRSRAALELMERDEPSGDVRRQFPDQPNASVDLRLDAKLGELAPRIIDSTAAGVGAPESARAFALAEWNEFRDEADQMTLREAFAKGGWVV